MATENGSALRIKVATKLVDGLTSNSASITRALRDVTNKYSNGFKAQEYGLGEGSFSLTANYDPDANTATYYTFWDFVTAYVNKTKLTVEFSDSVTGHKKITATCLVASCPLEAPMEENATFTVELSWDGAPTIATI